MKKIMSRPSTWVPLLVLACLASVPLFAQMTGQMFYVSFFARIIIYAIAACALNVALGYGGLISFGHALFLGLGAYAVGLSSYYEVGNGWLHLLVCIGSCALVALVTGVVSLRTTGIAFIMITLAFAQMGYFLFVSLKIYGGDDGLPITSASKFGTFSLGNATNIYIIAFLVLVLFLWWFAKLRVAPFGMALRGARQNARRVKASGVPVFKVQLLAYVISGIACGMAGFLLANLNAFASPNNLSWIVSGELIVILVIGGIGSVYGPLLGAIVFLGLEEVLKLYTEHWMVIFGPLIVLVAILGKRGIVGVLQRFDKSVDRYSAEGEKL